VLNILWIYIYWFFFPAVQMKKFQLSTTENKYINAKENIETNLS